MEIQSKNNPLIASIVKLKQKKYRMEQNKMLVEGERNVNELIKRNAKIHYIFYEKVPLKAKCEQIQCSPDVLAYLSQTVTPSNIVAVVSIPNMVFKPPSTKFLVLENISDPGNLGTLIRTALAFNFKHIYLLNCVDPTNDKVVRASMGNFWDVTFSECTQDDVAKLIQSYPVFLADMDGKNLESTKKPEGIMGIVLGNEANGVSEKMRSIVPNRISISMQNDVESLNVAVAGAIIMSYFKGD